MERRPPVFDVLRPRGHLYSTIFGEIAEFFMKFAADEAPVVKVVVKY